MELRLLFGVIILYVFIMYGCRKVVVLQEQNFPLVDIDLNSSKEDGNRIIFFPSNGDFIFEVRSRNGFGQAAISLVQGPWPTKVRFHLYLHGLESFSVNNGVFVLNTSMLSYPPYSVLCEINTVGEGSRETLVETSPYWMSVEKVSIGKVISEVPLQGGYVEVVIPKIVFESEPEILYIEWVDFFR